MPDTAELASKVSVINEGSKSQNFKIVQTVLSAAGKSIATATIDNLNLRPMETKELKPHYPLRIQISGQ